MPRTRLADSREEASSDAAFEARLEHELAERHGTLYGARRRARWARRRWRRPLALVAAAILVATAAVAAVPARLTLGLGQVVTIELPAGTRAPDQRDLLVHLLDARSGAEQSSVSIDSGARGEERVLLLLFGDGIAAERVRSDLERAFPVLSAGRWRIQTLEADLQTSLARVLGYRLFAIEPEAGGLERRRHLVLDQLGARGWKGEVSFQEADGIRVVEVRPGRTSGEVRP
jgi:hypothetical protein